ncbi:hypothetical protein D0C36_18975 [Mucilaginibacter conchicola]|uniref:Gliding motility-associated C-terminal domain-containing protein n=1 Tax=Mucilaginibacter conchicola TaxID=2303333 RepID=A0A372NQ89_9SPHI|nr:cadherin-like beta sandwich domain-containing protein [Mucilaginibacter conchicola]RFZ91028.1 hypothetical protein D0C36_18975 [Mucilaginibacter conchicola]
MEKLLLQLKNVQSKVNRSLLMGLFVLAFSLISSKSQAQVYYLTSDESATTANDYDALWKIGSPSALTPQGMFTSPTQLMQDLAHNRIFVVESLSASRSIKVLDAGSYQIIKSIPLPATVNSMRYDAVTDNIYFITTNSTIALDVADALYRVNPTTDNAVTLIKESITPSPISLALDIPHNRVFIYESTGGSSRGIKTFDLGSQSFTETAFINSGTVKDIAYDPTTNYLYYLTSDDVVSSTAATDALTKVPPGGSVGANVVIASAFTPSPSQQMGIDFSKNLAYIYEGTPASRAIKTVDLTNGSVQTVLNLAGLPSGITVKTISVTQLPYVTTASAASVTGSSAVLGGTVTRSDAAVTGRGVVYSSSNQTPTIGGNGVTQAVNGNGTGTFSASISLSAATTYYARAYATSSVGTTYGSVVSFATQSNDANLSNLAINSGPLSPLFGSGTTSYTASVANSISVIEVTPTINNANASVRVNNNPVSSGSAFPVALNVGSNTISTVVTAQDGTTKTYTVTVTRAASSDANLSAITVDNATLTPAFNTNTTSYTVSIPNLYSYVSMSATVNQPNATLKNNGYPKISGQTYYYNVEVGTTNINYVVTAQDGTTQKTYNVAIIRAKADQTITLASTASKTYGDADYSSGATASSGLTISYSSSNTNVATIVNNNVHIIGAGTTTITASQAGDGNYNAATTATQTLTVGKRAISIKPQPATKVYGNAEPVAYPYALTGSGLATGDGMTGSFTRVSGEAVGTYALSLGTKHPVNAGSGADMSDNYDITFISNDLTITARPVTITANSGQSKVYGQSDPAFQYGVTTGNTVNGDVLAGSLSRASGDVVGTYAINQGSLTNANNPNYNITFNPATFTITRAALTVTADNKTKDYSAPIPTLTYQISGLTNGDTEASLTSPVEITTLADANSAPGNYAIAVNGAANANYTIAFVNGILTINAPSADATLSNLTTSIGTLDPLFNPNTENYEVAVPDGTTQIGVTATVSNAYANVTVNNGSVTSGNSSTQSVAHGDNLMPIVVTAQNGDIKQYNLNVKVPLDKNAKLSGLYFFETTNGNYYQPDGFTFDQVVHSYTINVPNDIRGLRFLPSPVSTYSTTTINGTTYDGFYAPSLKPGTNVFTIVVTAQDPTYSETYTFTINRALSSNNNLFALALDGVTLSPTFNQATIDYTASVTNTQYSVNVSASLADTTARVKVNNGTYGNYINQTVNLLGGNNTIAIDVKAANGDFKTYTVVVNKALSTDASLSNLVASTGALSPTFDPAVKDYTQTVSGSQTSINLTPTVNAATTNVTVNGQSVISGNASSNLPLIYGSNTFNIVTTAESGATDQYTIVVTRPEPLSTNVVVSLKNNTNSTFYKTKVNGVDGYKISVPSDQTSIQITPTVFENATITINGTAVQSGSASAPINLNANGVTVITAVVTAQDHITTKTYPISVTRAGSNNAQLTLALSQSAVLQSTTGTADYNYTTSVSSTASSIQVTPTAKDANATITVNGVTVASGAASSPIALTGSVTNINVVATAEDGVTVKTYAIKVSRTGSNNAQLTLAVNQNAILQATTGTADYNYTTSVSAAISSIQVTPTAKDANATITVNGIVATSGVASPAIALSNGVTDINIVATAEDGVTVKTYSIKVSRTGSTNAQLSLALSDNATLQKTTGTADYNYTASVAANVNSVTLTPTAKDPNATITINGVAATSGVASSPIALSSGVTDINVVATAEDGVATKTYVIKVSRNGSGNAQMELALSNYALLERTTGTASYNYVTSVSAGVNSITITPTARDSKATITLNGVTVPSGVASSPIPLSSGVTDINLVCTAEDGVTVKTYAIKVSRVGSNNAQLTLSLGEGISLEKATTGAADYNYTASVAYAVSSVQVTPIAKEPHAVVTVNGVVVASKSASSPIVLVVGENTINVSATAEDGVTVKTYSIIITRALSNNADLATAETSEFNNGAPVGSPMTFTQTSSNTFEATLYTALPYTLGFKFTAANANSKIYLLTFGYIQNGGYDSQLVGTITSYSDFTFPIRVYAEDGRTSKFYTVKLKIAPLPQNLAGTKDAIKMVSKNTNSFVATDDVVVHQGVSPNGDGVNDYLVIEGLSNTTGNKLSVMNAAGNLVFETKDYGKDGANLFTGRSRNGDMLKAGTYYYSLEYQVGKETKRKTGYLILKY